MAMDIMVSDDAHGQNKCLSFCGLMRDGSIRLTHGCEDELCELLKDNTYLHVWIERQREWY
ncbi:hypothetical protein E2562_017318 [Oryza meyeriana var. granulata]|uniref:Uncharacterized protein n=1 Tax=Oryza meyeriana var. granulata TaxID=110450 RepID=A0A6G1EMB4_9ORYZ|nr:hypothetical protein E2562_017318 [Oryza meyeriana var. granulata]